MRYECLGYKYGLFYITLEINRQVHIALLSRPYSIGQANFEGMSACGKITDGDLPNRHVTARTPVASIEPVSLWRRTINRIPDGIELAVRFTRDAACLVLLKQFAIKINIMHPADILLTARSGPVLP